MLNDTASTQVSDGRLDDTAVLRRAHALIMEFDEARIRVRNFRTRRSAILTPPLLGYLRDLSGPTPLADAMARLPMPVDRAHALLHMLVNATVIHRIGSPGEIDDRHWSDTWQFGNVAAALNFTHRPTAHSGPAEPVRPAGDTAALPHSEPASHGEKAFKLPAAHLSAGVAGVMAERRSARRFGKDPVTERMLSQVLFALVGTTSQIDTTMYGRLPLSLSPSAGARSPYEVYLFADAVGGVPAGTYHYDKSAQTLLRLGDRPPDMAALADGQQWAAEAAFVVLLVAFLDRVWSKYPTPGGYLNTIVEAGHRAQNALLAATEYRLGARMTTAVADDIVYDSLRLCPAHQAPVYLLAFGRPAPPGEAYSS